MECRVEGNQTDKRVKTKSKEANCSKPGWMECRVEGNQTDTEVS